MHAQHIITPAHRYPRVLLSDPIDPSISRFAHLPRRLSYLVQPACYPPRTRFEALEMYRDQ